MARYGYGALEAAHFVGFLSELSQGGWKGVSAERPKKSEAALHRAEVLAFFRRVLSEAIDQAVVAQGAANDVESADPEWSLAERRLVGKVQLLMLSKDPDVAEAASRAQVVLCDGGGTGMVRLGADEKIDFGRNQLALAATPAVKKLIDDLGLREELDDVRECTEALAEARGRGDGAKARVPRSRRIEQSIVVCAAAFNWVHEGLTWMRDRTDDRAARDELDAMLMPFEQLLARRPVEAVVDETTDEQGPTDEAKTQEPVKRTG